MNQPEDNPTVLPVETPQAEADAPKPARRPRKPKAEAEAEAAVEPAVEAAVEGVAETAAAQAAPKPARKRKPKVEATNDATPAASAAEADASAKPTVAARSDTLDSDVGVGAAAPVIEPGAPSETLDAVDGETGAAGDAPRSSRNRRRGRKDRERGEGGTAADNAADAVVVVAPDAGEVFAHVMSAEFDVEETDEEASEESTKAEPPKRVLQAEPDAPKLHKVLAQAGVGSRRDMEELILEGKITVNDQPAHVGQRISFGDQIRVDGKPVRVRIVPPPPRIIAYHKPVGEVVTHSDPENRPTVFRRLPRLQQGKWQSVGRLDLNTEGLLLFTNSGELANQLMHPRFGVEREYAVRVLGKLTEDHKKSLVAGVDVEGQTASFKSIADGGGEGANHWYRVVITEGRNREVRKLFDVVGLTVSRLIRIR